MAGVKVVRNRRGQYAIWPTDRENVSGWSEVGKTGSKQECVDYIEEVWTDMRPLSVRERSDRMRQMEAQILRDAKR
jgi:MbtH protein